MDAYIYQAALWCEDCGRAIRERLNNPTDCDHGADCKAHGWPSAKTDEREYDSGDYPKGPYGDGGGESDTPNHCDGCRVFLENPLTGDGYAYVAEVAVRRRNEPDSVVTSEWVPFYGIDVWEAAAG